MTGALDRTLSDGGDTSGETDDLLEGKALRVHSSALRTFRYVAVGCMMGVALARICATVLRAPFAKTIPGLIVGALCGAVSGFALRIPENVLRDGPALRFASMMGDEIGVRQLCARGVWINLTDREGETAMTHALSGGYECIVETLVEYGAPVNTADRNGRTPLIIMIEKGSSETVKRFVKRGANVNLADRKGNTPLAYATEGGRADIVGRLLGRGASVDLANRKGRTPLMVAAGRADPKIVEALLKRGADPARIDCEGNSSLMHAIGSNRPDIVRKILDHVLDRATRIHLVNLANPEGRTPLMSAAEQTRQEIVKELLRRGADPNYADCEGKKAVDVAIENGHDEIARILEAATKGR